jgi:PhnB protein
LKKPIASCHDAVDVTPKEPNMSVKINPYLVFSGNARTAMVFYHSVLQGKLDVQTFGDFGSPVSEGYKDKVMHSVIDSDTVTLMASDDQEGSTPAVGDNVCVSLSGATEDDEQLTKIFAGLSEGGQITMPLGASPWGDKFGMFTDKFGIKWLINIAGAKTDDPKPAEGEAMA